MTVLLGTMSLPAPEDADLVRTYLNGTHGSGGLWEALTRSSNHDHTGGANGKPISISSIPDGSITTGKLDPSVLLPYALVDGSKPFTGQVTMQADAIVRDALYFGQQGSAVAPDATLTRTGAGALRVDTHLGVGVNPAAWGAADRVIQVGQTGVVRGQAAGQNVYVQDNSYSDGTNNRAIVAGFSSLLNLTGGGVTAYTAPSVAAGATQTFTQRLSLGNTGTLTLTPDGGQPSLVIGTASGAGSAAIQYRSDDNVIRWSAGIDSAASGKDLIWYHAPAPAGVKARLATTGTLTLTPDAGVTGLTVTGTAAGAAIDFSGGTQLIRNGAGNLLFHAGAPGVVGPALDNTVSAGGASNRYGSVWAVTGTVSASSAAVKEGITPLDPAACYQAAKDVRWYEFAYLPMTYVAPEPPPDIAYDAADDNETKAAKKAARDEAEAASKAAHLKMVAETAPARHQRGFVFPAGAESKDEAGGTLPPVPDLFGLSDRQSTTPQADLATLGCALQEVIRRLETLEAQP